VFASGASEYRIIADVEKTDAKITIDDLKKNIVLLSTYETVSTNTENGSPMQQYANDTSEGQKWYFIEVNTILSQKPYIQTNAKYTDSGNKLESVTDERGKTTSYTYGDTSKLLTRELKEELDRIFVKNEEYSSLMINILSFGFKHGIPADADLVFDVRFLPNPFYIDELKYLTGNDRGVQDYVMSFPEAGIFLDKLTDLLRFLIPNYIKEGKYQLVVAIGCTGGKHRSVTLANELYRKLRNREAKYGVSLSHRDI